MLISSRTILPRSRCALQLPKAVRFESTNASFMPRGRSWSNHRLTMPISFSGNNKFASFLNFLRANATAVGLTQKMIYEGRVEDMSYKLSSVALRGEEVKSERPLLTFENVREVLNGLQGPIQEIRQGATGPIRLSFGRLVNIPCKEHPDMSIFLSLRPLPGPETDKFIEILKLITKTLYEKEIPPMRDFWAFKDPTLNAQRISNIYLVTSAPRRQNWRSGDVQTFDNKKILALKGLEEWGVKQLDGGAEMELGEISLPSIQFIKGATEKGGRRTLEAELKF